MGSAANASSTVLWPRSAERCENSNHGRTPPLSRVAIERSRGDDEAVDKNRAAALGGRNDCACERGDFEPADGLQNAPWIDAGAREIVACEPLCDDGDLVRDAGFVEAGARACDLCRRLAEQCRRNGRGGCSVADTHFAEENKIGDPGVFDGTTAGSERFVEFILGHGGFDREVARAVAGLVGGHACNRFGRQRSGVYHEQRHTKLAREDGNGRTARREIAQHLDCDRGWKRRDVLRRDAVIARKKNDGRGGRARAVGCLQAGKGDRKLLKAAERSRRLGQLGLAFASRRFMGCRRRRAGVLDPAAGHWRSGCMVLEVSALHGTAWGTRQLRPGLKVPPGCGTRCHP